MKVRTYCDKDSTEEREEMVLNRSEQESEYERCLQMVLNDPGWVLDHLESLDEFQVNWKKYIYRKDGKRRG